MDDRRMSPELPDVIIQHIQSLLKAREGAQTMLVSKSWLRAWSARPFLMFHLDDFWSKSTDIFGCIDVFCDVIDRTLESYVEKGIPIVRFDLYALPIEERWLKMARKSNVIELYLTGNWGTSSSLFQEIFLTKSLQVLRLNSIGLERILSHTDIICRRLKKLQLINLEISEVTLEHIMSSCPLIEELMFHSCTLISDFQAYNFRTKAFMLAGECASLKRLSLFETEINDEPLQTILSKSPKLEDFKLSCCNRLIKPINLSSVALKSINIDRNNVEVVLIDAPNLHKVKYSSGRFQTNPFPISITSPKTKGTVKVSIVYNDVNIGKSWFHGLSGFLAKFAKSNVKFTLACGQRYWTDFMWLRAASLPPWHEVETLRFSTKSKIKFTQLKLLYTFFTVCHPKNVLLDRMGTMSKKELNKLFKDLNYRGNLVCCNFHKNKCWRHYIKHGELYYVVDNEKKPLDINGIETGLRDWEVITLDLKWEESSD